MWDDIERPGPRVVHGMPTRGHLGTARRPDVAPGADRQHSGLVIQTARDAWIYCKASKKMVAGNQMLPWLSASASVVSALTGLAVFASLQSDPSTPARVSVGAVAVVTGVIAALQTWAASRIRSLNNQAHAFHEFHRAVMADLEAGTDADDPDYPARRESELQALVAGTSEPSGRAWREAEERVDAEWGLLFPHLTTHTARPTEET